MSISRSIPGHLRWWQKVGGRSLRRVGLVVAHAKPAGKPRTIPKGANDGEVLEFVHEIEVKKSRFIARGWHVDSEAEALSLIKAASDPAASHNCWAIRIEGKTVRCNDDGEPGGTGGKPILNALEALDCDGSAVMVTRYFGGTKLGTGGLIRAYGGAVRELLNVIELEEMVSMCSVDVFVPVDLVGQAWTSILTAGGDNIVQGEFDAVRNGFPMSFDVVDGEERTALDKLRDTSRGRIVELLKEGERIT